MSEQVCHFGYAYISSAGGVVPIIPGACIFDLVAGNPVPPNIENVYSNVCIYSFFVIS